MEENLEHLIQPSSRLQPSKSIIYVLLSIFLVTVTAIYGYTQYTQKSIISTILQNPIDLNDTSSLISSISTSEHKLSSGIDIPKGTRFFGKLSKEENKYIIYFDSLQTPDGKTESFTAKSILDVNNNNSKNGVSAKISKTLYKQTKSNVLGAIFYNNSSNVSESSKSILPQGHILKLEFD